MFLRYVHELPFLVEILEQSLGYFYLDNFPFAYLCPNLSITLEYSVLPELTGTTTRLSESCVVDHSDGGSKVESAQDRKYTDHFYLHVTCHDYSWCLGSKYAWSFNFMWYKTRFIHCLFIYLFDASICGFFWWKKCSVYQLYMLRITNLEIFFHMFMWGQKLCCR